MKKKRNQSLVIAAVASELVVFVLVLTFIGHWLDQNYPTHGLGAVAGIFLGLTLWIVRLLQVMKSSDE